MTNPLQTKLFQAMAVALDKPEAPSCLNPIESLVILLYTGGTTLHTQGPLVATTATRSSLGTHYSQLTTYYCCEQLVTLLLHHGPPTPDFIIQLLATPSRACFIEHQLDFNLIEIPPSLPLRMT